MRHDEKLKIDGKSLILEDLRQHCLSKKANEWESDVFNTDTDKKTILQELKDKKLPAQSMYFEYMKRSHQLFVDRINEQESYKLMEDMSINTGFIKDCVEDTFYGKDFSKSENHVMKAAAEDWADLGS